MTQTARDMFFYIWSLNSEGSKVFFFWPRDNTEKLSENVTELLIYSDANNNNKKKTKWQLKNHPNIYTIVHFVPDLCSQTKNQTYSLTEAERTATRREDLLRTLRTHLFSRVVPHYRRIKTGWGGHTPTPFPLSSTLGGVAQVSCCVAVSETVFGNLQRFSAIPLPRPHPSVPSASGKLGLVWSGPDQAGLRVCTLCSNSCPRYISYWKVTGEVRKCVFVGKAVVCRVVATTEDTEVLGIWTF